MIGTRYLSECAAIAVAAAKALLRPRESSRALLR